MKRKHCNFLPYIESRPFACLREAFCMFCLREAKAMIYPSCSFHLPGRAARGGREATTANHILLGRQAWYKLLSSPPIPDPKQLITINACFSSWINNRRTVEILKLLAPQHYLRAKESSIAHPRHPTAEAFETPCHAFAKCQPNMH